MNINFKQRALKLALVSAFALGGAALGVNGHAASATGNATATVITPIAIANTADLAFGKFAASTGGTVVMSPAGTRTATGAVVLSTVTPGAAASFDVTGDNNATYAITLPATASIASGANTMTVDTFTSTPSATGTLSATGAETVTVGGTLTVASAQVAGAYTGTFDVTVEYN
ncbi:MAG: DUF4402 domain-containing protein [Thiobacillus sp.]|jgi:hypothetical protein